MKANEAPEKLYISSKQRPDKEIFYGTCTKVEDDDIEYTRTDAFVKKACDAYCKVCKMPNCRRNECKKIDDFKGYL